MNANEITINVKGARLNGLLDLPPNAEGLVLFAHGSGSGRMSPRNQAVAQTLRDHGLGTLLFDLLTADEEESETYTRHLRFNIPFLAERLEAATRWALDRATTRDISIGYFGSSTGAAAALMAAANLGEIISGVVSRGGRTDLAGNAALACVTAPTLFIVGKNDTALIPLNEDAYARLKCEKALRLIPNATHLFEEEGALEMVAGMAAEWFENHLHPLQRTA